MEHGYQVLSNRSLAPASTLRSIHDLVPGDHLCSFFETEQEHAALLSPFLRQGLEQKQKVVYIAQDHSRDAILRYLEADPPGLDRLLASGQFSVVSPAETYLRDGDFDPDRMIAFLRAQTDLAVAEGYSALRATGEMTWSLENQAGSDRLIEYEAKLNHFFPGSRCLALCQYDRRRFAPPVLLAVLATHPIAVVGTELYDNFYYIPVADFLGPNVADATFRRCLHNLQARRNVEAALCLARDEWERTFNCLSDGITLHDPEYNIRFMNRAFLNFFPDGVPPHRKCYEVVHHLSSPHPDCPLARGLETRKSEESEFFEPVLGRYLSIRCDPMFEKGDRLSGFVHVTRDVTLYKQAQEELRKYHQELELRVQQRTAELTRANASLQLEVRQRTQAEEELRRLNRVYSVASNINQAMVRIRDPQELFVEACRIAVETGRFQMAWIGLVDQATRMVTPVACAGREDSYLDGIRVSTDDVPEGRGPTGTAIRLGTHFISNDIATDARMLPWRDKALARGYQSCGAFALHSEGRVIGALNLYAREPDFFDRDEVRLFDELAADISFALNSIAWERQRAQAIEAVRQSEARNRLLIENAAFAIFRSTLDGRLLDANLAFVRMLGYDSVEEVLQLSLPTDVYCDPSLPSTLLEKARQTGHVEEMELEWKRKDGAPILVRFSGRLSRDPATGVEAFETIAEDITERRALQKQVAALQKFEAIGQLAGGIAHDFNNVIGAMMGWAELGAELAPAGSPLGEYFQKIYGQAERAAGLTRQLLAFARRQILDARNLDINESVHEVMRLLETLLGDNIETQLTLRPELPVARADPTQLGQVLMNLCLNARDAMPQGGLLRIETQATEVTVDYCRFHADARPGQYVVLSVSDTGVGMDANVLEHLFEPFFTTKEAGHGTGLGLATVYGIVKQHGGFINVYSEPGLGTTFRVFLPAAAGAAENQEPAAAAEVCGGTETILVAEDHEGLREAAREALTRLGYTVLLARDGEEAVRIFRAERGRIALALMDVVMPRLSGPQAYALMNALAPELPVIFVTGYTTDVSALGSFGNGRVVLLQKPYDSARLAHSVRRLLDASHSAPTGAAPENS